MTELPELRLGVARLYCSSQSRSYIWPCWSSSNWSTFDRISTNYVSRKRFIAHKLRLLMKTTWTYPLCKRVARFMQCPCFKLRSSRCITGLILASQWPGSSYPFLLSMSMFVSSEIPKGFWCWCFYSKIVLIRCCIDDTHGFVCHIPTVYYAFYVAIYIPNRLNSSSLCRWSLDRLGFLLRVFSCRHLFCGDRGIFDGSSSAIQW